MINRPLTPRVDKLKCWTSRPRAIAYTVLAAAAMLPALPAHGSEAPPSGIRAKRAAAALPLPAIPYLETTPWLIWEPYRHGPKVDTLLLPVTPLGGRLVDDHRRGNPLDLPTS